MVAIESIIHAFGAMILLLASWAGWGGLLVSGLGLSLCVGMALTLLFGALYLALITGPGAPTIAWNAWLLGGCLALVVQALLGWKRGRVSISAIATIGIIGLGATAFCLAELHTPRLNCYDDLLSYLVHIRMILERGDLVDPFSLRRLASYGGQQILQSFYLLHASNLALGLFEKGICTVVLLLLVREVVGLDRPWKAFFFVLVFLFVEVPRINTAPELSGACLVMGACLQLRRLTEAWERNREDRSRELMVFTVLVAACLYLRANYVVGIMVIFVSAILGLERGWRARGRVALQVAAAIALLLAPGAWMLYRSSMTPFFPLIHGNFVESYQTFRNSTQSSSEALDYLWKTIRSTNLISLLGLTVGLFVATWRIHREVATIVTAAMVSVVVTALSMTGTLDWHSVYRYSFPFLITSSLMIFSCWTFASRPSIRGSVGRDLLRAPAYWGMTFLFVVFCLESAYNAKEFFEDNGARIVEVVRGYRPRDAFAAIRPEYRQIQGAMPAGSRVLSIVEHPFLLDYSKNEIWPIDIPGNVSPGRGLDLQAKHEDIDRYFSGLGIDYVVFEDPNVCRCQYSRSNWTRSFESPRVPTGFFIHWLPHHLRLFEYLEAKKKSPGLVAKEGSLYLYDLRKSR